jgi:hypothetical protein
MHQIEHERSALDGAVVFVAMELSRSAWLLASQGSPSGKASSRRLRSGDVAGLLALLRRLQARERQVCGGGDPQVIVGHEGAMVNVGVRGSGGDLLLGSLHGLTVAEADALDHLGQPLRAVQPAPAALGGLGELVDHRQGRLP